MDQPLRTGDGLTHLVVAIDGPSGSGKSSVSRGVADALGLRYLDTGAMYRALTWWVLERGVAVSDQPAVARLAVDLPLVVGQDPRDAHFLVDGVDVSVDIRATRISEAVSAIATNLAVRTELVRRQREIIGAGGVVVEGRDITTVVASDAHVRILLTADERARLERRARELHGAADEAALAATHAQVVRRDALDSTVSEFRVAADGVHELDSSSLTLAQTVAAVLALVEQVTGISAATTESATVALPGHTAAGMRA